jgi:hypothetical protein
LIDRAKLFVSCIAKQVQRVISHSVMQPYVYTEKTDI